MSESPFLTPPEYAEMIEGWRVGKKVEDEKMSKEQNLVYIMGRHIGAHEKMDLNKLHTVDLIKFIEEKIQNNESSRKTPTMILDLGGGMHLLSDQLRATFGSKVKVISTSLSRETAEQARGIFKKRQQEIPYSGAIKKELHPDDSKMNSIFQLNKTDESGDPKAEFDLIIDTFGEQYYGLKGEIPLLEKYLMAIISKLKPGGMATIYPFGKYGKFQGQKIMESTFHAGEIYKIFKKLEPICTTKELREPGSAHINLKLIKK